MPGFASSLLEAAWVAAPPERCCLWHQLRGDGCRWVCCFALPLPHPRAGIKASSCWLRAGGIYLYWEDWESVIELSIATWMLWRGRFPLPSPGLMLLFPSHGAGRVALAFGGGMRLPVLTALTKPPGAGAACVQVCKPAAKRQQHLLKEPARREQPWAPRCLIAARQRGARPRGTASTSPPNW